MTNARAAGAVGWVVPAAIILFGVLLVGSFRALLPLGAVLTLALLVLGSRDGLWRDLGRSRTLWALAALVAIGALSWFTTLDQSQTGPKILQLSLLFAVGVTLIHTLRLNAQAAPTARLRGALFASVGFCAFGVWATAAAPEVFIALGAPGKYFNHTDHVANRAAAVLAVWSWVAALGLSPLMAFLVFGLTAASLAWFGVEASGPIGPITAMAIGSAAAVFGFLAGRCGPIVIASIAAVACIAAPLILAGLGDPPARESQDGGFADQAMAAGGVTHRLQIWTSTAERALERPVTGWGLDASRRVPATRAEYGTHARSTIDLHPHNAFLQVWLELGAPGAVAVAAILIAIGLAAQRFSTTRWRSACVCGAFGAALLIANVSFGAFQSWWLAALMIVAGFAWVAAAAAPGVGERDAAP